MPFIGKDWRSPGEAWVKTESLGWQRAKILANQFAYHIQPAGSWPPRNAENAEHFAAAHASRGRRHLDSAGESPIGTSGDDDSSSSPTTSPERHVNLPMNAVAATENDRVSPSTANNNCIQSRAANDSRQSRPITITNSNKNGRTVERAESSSPSSPNSIGFSAGYGYSFVSSSAPPQPTFSITCDDCNSRSYQQQTNNERVPSPQIAPHCQITIKPTKEVAVYSTISEAFCRLDFCNAIHDIRRFNYICKLLHLLITQNLTSLSGCATKILFSMLEQIAFVAASDKRNVHIIRNLLNDLKLTIAKYYCWGRPIGSSILWQQHFDTIERISLIVDGIELSPPKNSSKTFNDLPVEMIREILLRLNDYRDLINSAQAHSVMRAMIAGQFIWRQLCRYHFTEEQLKIALKSHKPLSTRHSVTQRNPRQRNLGTAKYARFSSADGSRSYRSAVATSSLSSSSSSPMSSPSSPTTSSSNMPPSSCRRASQVLNIIQSFEPKNTVKCSCKAPQSGNEKMESLRTLSKQKSDPQKSCGQQHCQQQQQHQRRRQANSGNILSNDYSHNGRDANEKQQQVINWECLFHEMRKKFDLKEEYPDILLLCRTCRCLFWRSFGHPCIDSSSSSSPITNSTFSLLASQHLSRSSHELRTTSSSSSPTDDTTSRVSVATLSRGFDQRSTSVDRANNNKNIAPARNQPSTSQPRNNRLPPAQFPIQLQTSANRQQQQYQQQNQRYPQQHQPSTATSNRNNTNHKKELVPKHVAVSPQAFLKFFSL